MSESVFNRLAQSAVIIAVHTRILKKRILSDKLLKTLFRLEVVIKPILFIAARRARGAGNGILDVEILLQKHIYKRALAAAGRCRYNNE